MNAKRLWISDMVFSNFTHSNPVALLLPYVEWAKRNKNLENRKETEP